MPDRSGEVLRLTLVGGTNYRWKSQHMVGEGVGVKELAYVTQSLSQPVSGGTWTLPQAQAPQATGSRPGVRSLFCEGPDINI